MRTSSTPRAFRPLQNGDGLLDAVRNTSVPAAGAIAVAEEAGATLVPLAWGFANPAGPVQDEAFERIAALICARLSEALDAAPLDGVYLDLHGAAVVESFPDAEGELLRRVRAIVGDLPLTISLDPHCNLTAQMVRLADAAVPFRTYPHIDMKAAGAQAMRLLLQRIARGAPWARAFRQIGILDSARQPVHADAADAGGDAGARVARRAAWASRNWRSASAFPTRISPIAARRWPRLPTRRRRPMPRPMRSRRMSRRGRASFVQDTLPSAEAVAEAMRIARGAARPVVVADTQDNPGGGGHGDTTELLAELVRQRAKGALFCLINDAESAAACHAAGEGATLSLSLGGKSDGMPFACTARVLTLSDGKFTLTGPMGAGNPGNLGPSALIDIEGVRVVVVSRKMQALDQAIIRHLGVEPASCAILALKSSVHFRADFAPIAEQVIVAIAPGPVVADPAVLNFRHVRAEVRRRPRVS